MQDSKHHPYVATGNLPGYQQSQCGPWGIRLDQQMQRGATLNASFDQLQWEDAKLNGCQPAPCQEYPSWPPPEGTGFIYPSLEKTTPAKLLGEDLGPGTEAAPYVEPQEMTEPVVPDPSKAYSVDEILNVQACSAEEPRIPHALPGATWAATQVDGNYNQSAYGTPVIMGKERFKNQACAVEAKALQQPPMAPQKQPHPMAMAAEAAMPVKERQAQPMQQLNNVMAGAQIYLTDEAIRDNLVLVAEENVDVLETDVKSCGKTDPRCTRYSLEHLWPCMINAMRGILYDISCWDDLPKDKNRLLFIFTRDDRMFYLATFVLFILILYCVLRGLWFGVLPNNSHRVPFHYAIWMALAAFFIYFMTPEAEKKDTLVKAISIFVIVVLGALAYNKFSLKK
jgi:hypothetical protein